MVHKEMVVVIGSESDLKKRAVEDAFKALRSHVRIETCAAEPGVRAQPMSLKEMLAGAETRAKHARELRPNGSMWIGIESGLEIIGAQWFDIPCVVIHRGLNSKSITFGTCFPIPTWMVEQTRDGMELGHVIQHLSGRHEKDAEAYLSKHHVSRKAIISQAVQCALAPILYPERFEKH